MPSSGFSSGLIQFKVTPVSVTRPRNALGQFTSAQNFQRERNHEMAAAIQRRAADLVEQRITWRFESTGELARNTLAPDNAQVDTWFLGVGNPRFLDRSSSKYWRTFEEGSLAVWSHPFVGTHLSPRRGGGGAGKGVITGFWTKETGRFVVRHEIQGRHVYADAASESSLRDFQIANIHQYVRDLLT